MNSTETAIVRGVEFLSGNQKSGAWEGFFGYGQAGDEWPTALTSRFLQAGQNLEDQLSCELHQARQMLIRHRRPLGWGFGQQSPPDCDSTANALLCLRNGSNLEILEQWRDPTGLWITYSTGDAFASQFDDFSKPMPCVSATVAELLSQHQRGQVAPCSIRYAAWLSRWDDHCGGNRTSTPPFAWCQQLECCNTGQWDFANGLRWSCVKRNGLAVDGATNIFWGAVHF